MTHIIRTRATWTVKPQTATVRSNDVTLARISARSRAILNKLRSVKADSDAGVELYRRLKVLNAAYFDARTRAGK